MSLTRDHPQPTLLSSLPAPVDPAIAPRLVHAARDGTLGSALLAVASGLAPVREVYAYRLDTRHEAVGQPKTLVSASALPDSAARADRFAQIFHRFDPVIQVRRRTGAQQGFGIRVPAAGISQPDYRAHCFSAPHFAEKLCFGWRDDAGVAVVSFYPDVAIDADASARLMALANHALAAMTAVWSGTVAQRPLIAQIEQRLSIAFPSLPLRERQVCARTLAGHTARDIGAALGVSAASVLTYRQRAHARLGISGAAQLLGAILACP